MYPGRIVVLPAIAVSCQQVTPRLESGASQVCRAASRKLESMERRGRKYAIGGLSILSVSRVYFLGCLSGAGGEMYVVF